MGMFPGQSSPMKFGAGTQTGAAAYARGSYGGVPENYQRTEEQKAAIARKHSEQFNRADPSQLWEDWKKRDDLKKRAKAALQIGIDRTQGRIARMQEIANGEQGPIAAANPKDKEVSPLLKRVAGILEQIREKLPESAKNIIPVTPVDLP
jgi:hypothetical protein